MRAMVEAMVTPVPRQQQRVVNHCLNQLLCFTLENIILGTSVLYLLAQQSWLGFIEVH